MNSNILNKAENNIIHLTNMKAQLMQPLDVGCSTLMICHSGWAVVLLYNKKQLFRKGDILIANWDMHPVFLNTSNHFSTFYYTMPEDVFYDVFRHISNAFCQFTYNYPIFKLTTEQSLQLSHWVEQVLWINKNISSPSRNALYINYLQSLMYAIDEEIQKISRTLPIITMPRQLEILREFGALLQTHIKEHHDVGFYASKLAITPYYLSTITSKVMQESPKSLIDRQLIQEIKKRIIINAPLKLIADELYFEDTSYMSKFFKRHTGLNPSEYKGANIYR